MEREEIKILSEMICKLKYHEWVKLQEAIDKKYSRELAQIKISNAQELTNQILLEMYGTIK